jgi:hypothetical protein
MKYATEMGSKCGSAIQKLIQEYTHRDTQHGDCISLLLLFQDKESKLETAK